MKLRLPHKFQAALVAALASVSFTTLSSATAFAEETAPAASDGDLGLTLFMGDSITHGVLDASYRWQLFKTFVDNGAYFNIDGPISGYYSTPADADNTGGSATYRGVGFVNEHYAKASGRSYEMVSGASRYNNISVATLGQTYDISTGALLIGTNDLLSDNGYTYDNFNTKMQNLLGGTVTHSTSGTDAVWTWQKGSTMGNLGTIADSMNLGAGDEFYVLSVPTWTTHNNNNDATLHAAVAGYNGLLQQWVTEYNATSAATVKYVDVNQGLVDVTSTTPFFGNKAFFNNGADGLHPSEQGSLIMAGNTARAMGIGGRTAGLSRSAATADGWAHAEQAAISVTRESGILTYASGELTATDGYTVDFSAVFGDGSTNNWLDADKDRLSGNSVAKLTTFSTLTESLNITVADGEHAGTLKLAEGYVAWSAGNGDMVLYSQDNSVSGESFRIAYREADSANNILGGYYVWKGDMLIGQGLAATVGTASGISLSITGSQNVGGSIGNLSWANTAYAPSTNLFSLEPLPSHDAAPVHLDIDFTDATAATGQYGTTGQATTGTLVLLRQNETQNGGWFGPVGTAHSGDVSMKYSNVGTTNNANIISVINGGITNGGLSVVLDDGTHVGKGHYGSTGDQSFHGVYQQSVSGALQLEVNNATLDGGIIMGVISGSGSVGSTNLLVNAGAAIGGDIYGGNSTSGTITGNTAITITGGSVAGGVYGGNQNGGTINGSTSVTITGGVISGNVAGGNQTSGTINGTTSVTIVGNLARIGGSISADTVTLQSVTADPDHSDTFDKYRGRIRADKVVLHQYTVDQMLASLETKSLVLQGNSKTTVGNLTLTACEITVEDGSELTLEGVNTYGNTTTYSGHVAIANGTTFTLHTATMTGEASGYSDGENGFAMGTMIVLNPLAEGNSLYGADGTPLTSTTTDTLIGGGILTGATFSYDAATGQLTAAAQGTGGPYYVNEGTVVYRTGTNVYTADDIRLNGGILQFQETLKDGTALSVIKAGSGIIVDNGVSLAVNRIDAASLDEFGVTLTGAMTASSREELLSKLTGTDANITTTANITLNSGDTTTAGGVLTVGDGYSLNLDKGKGTSYNLTSFRQMVLGANSVINYFANSATFNNVTLANGDATISITDHGGTGDMLTLAGTTSLNGHKLTINGPSASWKRYVTITALTGDADSTLLFEGGRTNDGSGSHLTINSLQGFSGTLELKEIVTGNPLTAVVSTTANSTVNLAALKFTGTGEELQVRGNSNAPLVIGSATIGNGSTAGSAIIKTVTNGSNTGGNYIKMDSLHGSGTLVVNQGAASTTRTTLDLGGANTASDFTGTIELQFTSGIGNNRGVFLVINDEHVAANAELKFTSPNNNSSQHMGVGLNADVVKVAGIGTNQGITGSFTLFSGDSSGAENAVTYKDYGSRGGMRTLEITGAGTYTSGIQVLNNISLHMNGAGGTQTFNGNLSLFNGAINVTNGTLNLTPNSAIATHAVNVESAGTLTIAPTGSNAITAYATMHNAGTLNLTGTVKLDTVHMTDFTMVEGTEGQQVYSGVDRDSTHYANSGYLTSSAQYYLVKGTGTVSGDYTIDANTGSKVDAKSDEHNVVVTFKTNGAGGMFYVNDSFTYGSDMDAASDISIAREKTLTAAGSEALSSAKVLHGEGTYALASGASALNGNLTLGTDWTGTVRVSGVNNSGLQLGTVIQSLRQGNSWVELSNVAGKLDGNNVLYAGNIILTDTADTTAMRIIASTSGNNTHLTGDIKGEGSIERRIANGNTLTFDGDLSGWTGAFYNGGKDGGFNAGWNVVNFTHGGEINADFINRARSTGCYLTLVYEADTTVKGDIYANPPSGSTVINVTANANTTFMGTVNANTLTVAQGKTATMATDAIITGITNNGTLEIAKEKTLTFNAANYNANFGKLKLNDGATLLINNQNRTETHTIGSITLADGATGTINHKDPQYNAKVNIGTLVGDSDSTLNLWTTAKVSNVTVYDMNGGDGSNFNGTIVLSQKQGGTRRLAMNINDGAATQLQNSIVKFSGSGDSNAQVGLGVHAENVTVKGIVSDTPSGKHYIFSGAASSSSSSDLNTVGDNEDRTLTINTGDSAEASYSTRAWVGSHLSLVKEGAGTQTFSGDMSAFNGSLTVNNGTLEITGANGITVSHITSGTNEGTLDVTNTLTLSNTGLGQYSYNGTLKLGGLHVVQGIHQINGIDRLGESIQISDGILVVGSGTYNLSELELVENEISSAAASGYEHLFSGTVQFSNTTGGGYLMLQENLTFTHGGHTTQTLDADTGVVSFEEYDYTTYYLNAAGDTLDLSTEQAAHAELQKVVVNASGSVSLDDTRTITSLSQTPETVLTLTGGGELTIGSFGFDQSNTYANISIDADSTLRTGDLTVGNGQAFTTAGEGTYFGGILTVIDDGTTVNLGSNVQLTKLGVTAGNVNISGVTTVNDTTDLSKAHTSTGVLTVKASGTLNVNGDLWGRSASHLYLEQGGTVNIGSSLTIVGAGGDDNAELAATTNDERYAATSANWVITNAAVTTHGNITLGNKLTNSSLNTGGYAVTLSNAANTLAGVTIGAGGKLTVTNGLVTTALSGTGTLDVAGTLTVTNADASDFGGTLAVGGLTKDGAGELAIHGISRLGSSIQVTEGSLHVAAGTYDISALTPTQGGTTTPATSGYSALDATVTFIEKSGEGTFSKADSGLDFVYKGNHADTLTDEGTVHITGQDYTTYYLVGAGDTLNLTTEQGTNSLLQNVALNATAGTITVTDGRTLTGNLTQANGSTLTVAGGGSLTVSAISNNAAVSIGAGTSLTSTEATMIVDANKTFTTSGEGTLHLQTLRVDGSNAVVTLGAETQLNMIATGAGTLNINSDATMTTMQIGLYNAASTVNIGADATVHVTGTNVSDSGGAGNASFMVSNYGQTNTLNIEGHLIAEAGISSRDGRANVNVKDGGTLELHQGLRYASHSNGAVNVNVEDGGTLLTAGYTTDYTNKGLHVNLADGSTLRGYYGTGNAITIAQALTLSGLSNTAVIEAEAGKTITVSGAIGGTGGFTKTGGGTLALTGNNSFTRTIALQSGSLGMNGGTVTVDAANMGNFTKVEGSTSENVYSDGDNGFLISSAEYYLVKGDAGTTATQSAAITGGEWVTREGLGAGDLVFKFSAADPGQPSGLYFVNENMSTTDEGGAMTSDSSTGFVIAEGSTLTAANADAYATAKKLHGAGTYALFNGASALNGKLTIASDWTGTVRISSGLSTKLANLQTVFSNLANGTYSTVEAHGVQGWLGGNVATNLMLTGTSDDGTGTAIQITDGSSGATRVFSGTVSGKGDLAHTWVTNGAQTYDFSGDVSAWEGSFKDSGTGTGNITVTFSGQAREINAGIYHGRNCTTTVMFSNSDNVVMHGSIGKDASKTLNLVVDAPTTFTNTMDVTNMTVNAGMSATIAGATTSVTKLTGNSGSSVVVEEGSTLTITGGGGSRNNSQVYALDNRGTISLKAANGDIRFYGTEDGQVFNMGHLNIDGSSGTTFMLTAGEVNHTTDIEVKSLSGGGTGHTLQVTTCYSGGTEGTGKVVNFILGDETSAASAPAYTGTIQYGTGSSYVKTGGGMNLVIKDEHVAANAVLETSMSGGTYATVTVDTDRAQVKGLKDATTGKTVNVRGTEATENRVLEIVGEGNYSYGGKLGANLDVVHSGSGTQSFGGVDGFNGSVDVEAGVLNIMNAASVNVQDVTIGANGTLGVYSGASATAETASEGILTIKDTKSLTAGSGAKLNANLVMESGSTLDVRGTGGTGLLMGSDVTLSKGMTLNDYSSEWATWKDGTTYALFTGVDGLNIGSGTGTAAIDYTQWVDASEYFTNIKESNRYFLCYDGAPADNQNGVLQASFDGSNVGMVYVMVMPEPTTSTLSLLALCALAARRRRK